MDGECSQSCWRQRSSWTCLWRQIWLISFDVISRCIFKQLSGKPGFFSRSLCRLWKKEVTRVTSIVRMQGMQGMQAGVMQAIQAIYGTGRHTNCCHKRCSANLRAELRNLGKSFDQTLPSPWVKSFADLSQVPGHHSSRSFHTEQEQKEETQKTKGIKPPEMSRSHALYVTDLRERYAKTMQRHMSFRSSASQRLEAAVALGKDRCFRQEKGWGISTSIQQNLGAWSFVCRMLVASPCFKSTPREFCILQPKLFSIPWGMSHVLLQQLLLKREQAQGQQ